MSWLSELFKKIKPQVEAIDRETAMWIAFKALTPKQRAAFRVEVAAALRALDDPKTIEIARLFLKDVNSAINH